MQQVLSRQDVRFRSAEQELALHVVVNRQTPLVVVLLTSRGKSLLFSVPACINNARVTVVVVLY
jgi:superfamily II DNA helicase RecQ